jgi:hypothetical protein
MVFCEVLGLRKMVGITICEILFPQIVQGEGGASEIEYEGYVEGSCKILC